jgi:hypothetical protein
MSIDGKLKSAELRDELIRVDAAIAACKQDEVDALAGVKSLARLAIQPDQKDALAKVKQLEGRLGHSKMAHRRLLDARHEVEAELAAALAAEDLEAGKKDAAEAEAFAATLPNTFRECDVAFGNFRRAFSGAIGSITTARSRGWSVPSQELFQSKIVRALRTSLSVGELRMLDMPPLPSTERCSFESLGQAYSKSIRGGARSSLTPKPIAQPMPQQAKPEDTKLPPRGDIGLRFKDDPHEFEIRDIPGRWR